MGEYSIMGRMKVTNIIWVAIKIIWAVVCLSCAWPLSELLYTELRTGGTSFSYYGDYLIFIAFFTVLDVWFFIGLTFCIFQHKKRKLKYGIAVHIIATFIGVMVLGVLLDKWQ
jgi:hypothetical protein